MIVFSLTLVLLLKDVVRRPAELFSPRTFFLLGFLWVLGIGLLRRRGVTIDYDGDIIKSIELWSIVGLAAFELGVLMARGLWGTGRVVPVNLGVHVHPQRLLLAAVIAMAVGLWYLGVRAESYGLSVSDYLLANRALPERLSTVAGEQYFWWVAHFTSGAGALGLLGFIFTRKRSYRILFAAIVIVGFVCSFQAGSRFSVVQYLACVGLFWHFRSLGTRRHKVSRVVLALAIAVIAYASVQLVTKTRFSSGGLRNVGKIEIEAAHEGTFYSADMLNSTVTTFRFFPAFHEHLWGTTYWGTLVNVVPRALWPGKPKALGIIMSELRGGVSYSEAVSSIGELYANFGTGGIPVGMFVFGLTCQYLFVLFGRHRNNVLFLVPYLYSLGFFAMMVRGEFMTVWVHYYSNAVPLYLALRLCARRLSPQLQASPTPALGGVPLVSG